MYCILCMFIFLTSICCTITVNCLQQCVHYLMHSGVVTIGFSMSQLSFLGYDRTIGIIVSLSSPDLGLQQGRVNKNYDLLGA